MLAPLQAHNPGSHFRLMQIARDRLVRIIVNKIDLQRGLTICPTLA
jgi:hypothetical protein